MDSSDPSIGLIPFSLLILIATFIWEFYKSIRGSFSNNIENKDQSLTDENNIPNDDTQSLTDEQITIQNWILTAILGIASYFYILIYGSNNQTERVTYRYADWLPTTTLLVYNYWSLGTSYGWEGPPVLLLMTLNAFMIGLGYMTFTDPVNSQIYNVLSFGCLFVILWYFHKMSQYMRRIARERNDPRAQRIADAIWFFYAWPIYGLVHQVPALHDSGYAILDVYTKAGYSGYLNL